MVNPLLSGIILLDKPPGMTSLEATENVRRILGAKKAGNTGVLDPNSTGILIVCLGEATKAMPLLIGLDKEYETTIRLHKDVDKKQVIETLKTFVGKIRQIPPVKSSVARKERVREIYSINVLWFSGRDVTIKIRCQAGFYVRKFAHDFGQKLGCGAQMISLRRTDIDGINVSECIGFDKLDETKIIKLEDLLDRIGLKKVFVEKENLPDIRNGKGLKGGQIVSIDKDLKKDDLLGIYIDKKIVAIGKVLQTNPIYIKPDRILN